MVKTDGKYSNIKNEFIKKLIWTSVRTETLHIAPSFFTIFHKAYFYEEVKFNEHSSY